MHEISLSTDRRTQLVDITGQVQEALDGDAEYPGRGAFRG